MQQSTLYAHKTEGGSVSWTDFYANARLTKSCDPSEPVYKVQVVADENGDHWGWWDNADQDFAYVEREKSLVAICFPDISLNIAAGEGLLLKVRVEELERWQPPKKYATASGGNQQDQPGANVQEAAMPTRIKDEYRRKKIERVRLRALVRSSAGLAMPLAAIVVLALSPIWAPYKFFIAFPALLLAATTCHGFGELFTEEHHCWRARADQDDEREALALVRAIGYLLGMGKIPELYFFNQSAINAAYDDGDVHKLVISAPMWNALEKADKIHVLAHEIAHAYCLHARLQRWQIWGSFLVPILGLTLLHTNLLLAVVLAVAAWPVDRMIRRALAYCCEFDADEVAALLSGTLCDLPIAATEMIDVADEPELTVLVLARRPDLVDRLLTGATGKTKLARAWQRTAKVWRSAHPFSRDRVQRQQQILNEWQAVLNS